MASSPNPYANTPGFIAAREIVRYELVKAQQEVTYAEKPGTTFSGANRDRAILRRNVLLDLLDKLK